MSAFAIFALVLTVVYIMYYGFMFAYDQYGVRSDAGKEKVEEIAVPGGRQEVSRRVVSDDENGGYRILDEGEEEDPYSDIESDVEDFGSEPEVPVDREDDSRFMPSSEGGTSSGPEDTGSGSSVEESPSSAVDDTEVSAGGGTSLRDYERVLQIQESNPTVFPRYQQEYDLSSMMVLLMQPAGQRPSSRIRIHDISENYV